MKYIILTLLLIMTLSSYSQDLIIRRDGNQIDCKITKVDSAIIHYEFIKGERKLSSYISMSDIRSYKIDAKLETEDFGNDHDKPDNMVIIDTTKYVKENSKWTNLITYSKKYGLHANGWSIQYYGYNLKNTSNWSIPILFCIESNVIYTDYFSKFNYQSASMSYYSVGISPFYKMTDYLFVNFGANIIYGNETLTNYFGKEIFNTFWGLAPSQGIYFISKSKLGLTFGLSVYEKILSSEIYKNDLGIKLEMGIKF